MTSPLRLLRKRGRRVLFSNQGGVLGVQGDVSEDSAMEGNKYLNLERIRTWYCRAGAAATARQSCIWALVDQRLWMLPRRRYSVSRSACAGGKTPLVTEPFTPSHAINRNAS
jgi:hypothetical protein